jgi:hypothetical protein
MKKGIVISAIATISGLLQHFSGIEIGSNFGIALRGITALFCLGLYK